MTWNLRRDEEEKVFRRKLLYDGHGSGEDKKLVNIIRNITKLCLDQDPNDDTAKLFNLITRDLSSAINAAEKHAKVLQMCDRTFLDVEKAIQSKKEDIECIQKGLGALELELQFAEKLRKVSSWPDCHTTEKTMRDIALKKERYMVKLEKQRVSIRAMVDACKTLAKILDEDFDMDIEE